MSEQQEKRCGDCAFWNKELAYCQLTITTRLSNDVGCEKHKTSYELDREYRKKQEQARIEKEGELKPCPFCGRKVKLEEDVFNFKQYNIVCEDCHAGMGVRGDIEQAVETWTRRAE